MAQQDKSEIYRWEKISKPRVYSRSQRIASEDDVQNWIKKVEEASSQATAATFGRKPVPDRPVKTTATAHATIADMHIHDAAYAEAQELLQQWVSEKVRLDAEYLDNETDDGADMPLYTSKTAGVKKAWDNLLQYDENDDDILSAVTAQSARSTSMHSTAGQRSKMKSANDGATSVEAVLKSMMEKDILSDDKLLDLDLDPVKRDDPHLKMQLRHQQVRENRERRLQDKQKKLEEQRAKKEAMFKAMQLVKKEEEDKMARLKREELAIQQEMAKIRKEMEAERRQKAEEKKRDQRAREEFERNLAENFSQVTVIADVVTTTEKQPQTERKRQLAQKVEAVLASRLADDLRLKQRCFAAWYNLVIKRRLQIGQLKALADWKFLLRAFNGWKSYVRQTRLERDALNHEKKLKEEQRHLQMADAHYRCRLLKKCVLLWRIYVTQEQNQKLLDQMQTDTKRKMAALLQSATAAAAEAAAIATSSRQQQQQQLDTQRTETSRTPVTTDRSQPASVKSAAAQPKMDGHKNISQSMLKNVRKPTEPWQVVKSHLKLRDEELFGPEEATPVGRDQEEDQNAAADDNTVTADNTRASKILSRKKPFTVDRYEHRHAAQQRMLEVQQKQLQEQQRLIEEMQYLQRQQLLQQQLAQQQAVWTGLTGQPASDRGTPDGAMQKHVGALAKELDLVTQADNQASSARSESVSGISCTTPSMPLSSRPASQQTTDSKPSIPTDPRHLSFLQAMESRAAVRNQLKMEREEKRRKAEEEKLAKMKAEQEERILAEEAEKKRRIEEHKERKRLEKLREQEKTQQEELLRVLTAKATEHSRVRVMKFRGWLPWQQLMRRRQKAEQLADNHHRLHVLRKCLISWNATVQQDLEQRRAEADSLYKVILLQRCFRNWRRIKQNTSILEEKARRFWRYNTLAKIIAAWKDYAEEEKVQGWHKERRSREHSVTRMKKTAFRVWRQFPLTKKAEAEAEKRRAEMRKKVQMLLPDYRSSAAAQSSIG